MGLYAILIKFWKGNHILVNVYRFRSLHFAFDIDPLNLTKSVEQKFIQSPTDFLLNGPQFKSNLYLLSHNAPISVKSTP